MEGFIARIQRRVLAAKMRSRVTPPRRRRWGDRADRERMVYRRATLGLRPGAMLMATGSSIRG